MDLTTNNLPVVTNGSLESYITYINQIPMLTEQEELSLALEWKNNENPEAAKYLVLSHLRLVVSIARGYLGYGLPLADLIQEGTLGLIKAVKKFNPERKVRLVTFAMHWIKAEINDYIIKNWRLVRTVTNNNQRKLFFNLRSSKAESGRLSDKEATEIALKLGVKKEEVFEMNTRLYGNDVSLELDSSNNEDNYSQPISWLSDETITPDYQVARKHKEALETTGITEALDKLDERSRIIIQNRWLDDSDEQKTLQELADELGISAERVRQLETKAMETMRKSLVKNKEYIEVEPA